MNGVLNNDEFQKYDLYELESEKSYGGVTFTFVVSVVTLTLMIICDTNQWLSEGFVVFLSMVGMISLFGAVLYSLYIAINNQAVRERNEILILDNEEIEAYNRGTDDLLRQMYENERQKVQDTLQRGEIQLQTSLEQCDKKWKVFIHNRDEQWKNRIAERDAAWEKKIADVSRSMAMDYENSLSENAEIISANTEADFKKLITKAFVNNPYKYPRCCVELKGTSIDVKDTRRRNVQKYLLINGVDEFHDFYEMVQEWKKETLANAKSSDLDYIRLAQYADILDDDHMFYFVILDTANDNNTSEFYCDYVYVLDCWHEMELIGLDNFRVQFSQELLAAHKKRERARMTRDYRVAIMKRDNYTCQKCGKYMPDEVGLQIDHIIPVSKGGTSDAENLQVLCSKCNGRKSNKIRVHTGVA